MKKIYLLAFFMLSYAAVMAQAPLIPYQEGNLFGYKKEGSDKWVVKPKYTRAGKFAKNGLAFACTDKWHCGCIDTNFKVKIPFIYYCDYYMSAPTFTDSGTLLAAKAYKWYGEWVPQYGMINEKGKTVLPFNYDLIHETSANGMGYYVLRDTGMRYGAIDFNGKITIPFKYGPIALLDENVLQAGSYPFNSASQKRALIDLNNNILLPQEYQYLEYHKTKGVIIAQKNNQFGMLRTGTMEVLIPFNYDEIRPTWQSESTVWVKKENKFGFSDYNGKMLTEVVYENPVMTVMEEKGNRIMATLNGKYGALTVLALPAIPFEYEYLSTMGNGIYVAKKNGKYGYIDSAGNIIADFLYDSVSYFYGYFSIVKRNNLYGAVDMKGKLVVPIIYENLDSRYLNHCGSYWQWHRYMIFKENNMYGLIDYTGKKVLNADYQDIYLDHNAGDLIIAKQNGYYGFIDTLGNAIIPFSYVSIASSACSFMQFLGGFLLVNHEGQFTIDWNKKIAVKREANKLF